MPRIASAAAAFALRMKVIHPVRRAAVSLRHRPNHLKKESHVGFDGNLTVMVAEGFGGKLIRTISFLGFFFGSSSSPPKPVATVGPRGGRGGGLLACGFGFGLRSSGIVMLEAR